MANSTREAFWRELIQKRERLQWTVKEACRQASVSTASFFYWQKRLREQATNHAASPLVPVKIVDDRAAEITIELPGEVRMRVLLGKRVVVNIFFAKHTAYFNYPHPHDLVLARAPRSPWQNPFVERLIGSIRRECLDHVIVLNEVHLCRILKSYFVYYHESRTHMALDNNAPIQREAEPPEWGDVVSLP